MTPNPGVIVTLEPPPAGACIVRALPLVLVVKPVNSRDVGVYETESNSTASGCKVQLISLPTIEILVPAVNVLFELVIVTVPNASLAEKPMKCKVLGVVLAALSKASRLESLEGLCFLVTLVARPSPAILAAP